MEIENLDLVPKQTRLSCNLHAAFEAEPLECGINHPAEEIIAKALQSPENRQVVDQLESLSLDAKRPGFAASVLRCIGRQVNPGTASWRAGLVRAGLAADNAELRDAAVQTAESWDDRNLTRILISHRETEPWLRNYIRDVIKDLEERPDHRKTEKPSGHQGTRTRLKNEYFPAHPAEKS